ncbi:MAG TPA: hypothetical protein VLG16_03260 [Candidatus Saccharimonadales bacterium]|nr:hypothetical protein [Candidatus Saccharimonadales bacterium]
MNGENSTTPPEQQPGWRFKPDSTDNSTAPTYQQPIQGIPNAGMHEAQQVPTPQSTPTPQSSAPVPQPMQSTQAAQQAPQPIKFTNDTQPRQAAPAMPFINDESQARLAAPEADWSASEFIDHEKGSLWYIALGLATIIIAGGVFLIAHDIFSVVAVVAALIIFGVMAKRKPKMVQYHVGSEGLRANGRVYAYANFKSFGLQDEGPFSSLVFMPMKRFMLPIYVYFPPEDLDKIMETLSFYIPFSPIEQAAIDKATHRLRF